MIRAKLEYNTKHLNVDGKMYCAYCGKEIKPDAEVDHYEITKYYHCDCSDAFSEIEIMKKIESLKNEIENYKKNLPVVKYKIVTKKTIEFDLSNLNNRI